MPHNYPKSPKPGRGRHVGGHGGLGGNHRKDGCCSYVEAGKALRAGKGRLAVRFVRMDLKARMGLI